MTGGSVYYGEDTKADTSGYPVGTSSGSGKWRATGADSGSLRVTSKSGSPSCVGDTTKCWSTRSGVRNSGVCSSNDWGSGNFSSGSRKSAGWTPGASAGWWEDETGRLTDVFSWYRGAPGRRVV